MRVYADMFGPYHVSIYEGGVAIEVVAPDMKTAFLQGEEAAMLCDEIDDAAHDIAHGNSRWSRLGERAASEEILGVLFV